MTRQSRPLVSIELLLDADTERRVREDWQRLADAGFSSMAAHTAASNRPHVTLLVRTDDAARELAAVSFVEVAASLPLAVDLGAPVRFVHGDRCVLALPVEASPGLRELHARAHRLAGAGEDAPFTRPAAWTPHVTLARRLKVTDAAAAEALVRAPYRGTATALRRWDAATRTVTMFDRTDELA